MKRSSIAEITLKKQIDALTLDIELLWDERNKTTNMIDALTNTRERLRAEVGKLYNARVAASESRKPA